MNGARKLLSVLLGKRHPRHEGTLTVRGLSASTTIVRDRFGVPYIEAAAEADAWFALGFCHAQDRAAQLELIVRAVRGTLAAMIGPDGVAVDRLSRRIGFRRSGEAQLMCAAPLVTRQLRDYVRGVNAGLGEGPRAHELALLGCEPTAWESADVQGYSALLCFMLASNWDAELMRLKVLELDGPHALAAIDPSYPSHLPTSLEPLHEAGTAADRLAADLATFDELVGRSGGSNAWAVSGDKTASGRPILANDLHLLSALPAPTYLAQLRAPGVEVAGASWVGVPGFAPGHNGHIAWGATAAHADNTDLFVERIGPDGRSVQHGEELVRCEVLDEVIEVRGHAPIVERVLLTPRGPIIATAALAAAHRASIADAPVTRGALSIAATWLASRPYGGLYLAHRARSFAELRSLFAAGSTSTVSNVYADADGHIGWFLAVEVPRRRAGFGAVPMPGWRPECGWDGVVPFDELPRVSDPPRGFVCTANNQPHKSGAWLGVDFLDGYRQQAIAERLAAKSDWDLDATSALQRDTTSLPWREIGGAVLATRPTCADSKRGRALLAAWDGRMASDSVGASVFALFCAALARRVVRSRAPRASAWALGQPFTALIPTSTLSNRRMGHLCRLIREQPDGYVADWSQALASCLAEAVAELSRRHGDDSDAWRWGSVRPLVMEHAFAQQPPLHHVFNIGPLEGAGDNTTIDQGGVDFATAVTRQGWVPLLRAVFDVGNWDACRFAMVGGQSGNPCSEHYDDQVAVWRSGEGVALAWTRERIAATAVRRLELRPTSEPRQA